MPLLRNNQTISVIACASCLAGCVNAAGGASFDVPVPPSEPRAEVSAVIDLPSQPHCDEDFSLGLYANRGIEWISWARGSRPCTDLGVVVRYLPRRISRTDVVEEIRRLTARMELKDR
jgi:hypothetical protein